MHNNSSLRWKTVYKAYGNIKMFLHYNYNQLFLRSFLSEWNCKVYEWNSKLRVVFSVHQLLHSSKMAKMWKSAPTNIIQVLLLSIVLAEAHGCTLKTLFAACVVPHERTLKISAYGTFPIVFVLTYCLITTHAITNICIILYELLF